MDQLHVVSIGSSPLRIELLNAHAIVNKSFILDDLYTSKTLDFLILIETWQRTMDYGLLIELRPPDCPFSALQGPQAGVEDSLWTSGTVFRVGL